MQKQKKQMLIMLVLVLVIAAAYVGLQVYNKKQEEKQATNNNTIAVTDFGWEDITKFSYNLEGEEYSYTKDGENWIWDGDDTMDLQESMVKTMLKAVANLRATDKLTEYESISDFGLSEPGMTVKLTTATGTTILYIGDENAVTANYYIQCNDDDSIYLISKDIKSFFSNTPEDMMVESTEGTTEDSTDTVE